MISFKPSSGTILTIPLQDVCSITQEVVANSTVIRIAAESQDPSAGIPSCLFTIPWAEMILVEDNPMINGILPEFSVDSSPLQMLSFRNDSLTGTIPQSFSQLTSMEWMDLSYNGVTGGLENFNSMSKLQYH